MTFFFITLKWVVLTPPPHTHTHTQIGPKIETSIFIEMRRQCLETRENQPIKDIKATAIVSNNDEVKIANFSNEIFKRGQRKFEKMSFYENIHLMA